MNLKDLPDALPTPPPPPFPIETTTKRAHAFSEKSMQVSGKGVVFIVSLI